MDMYLRSRISCAVRRTGLAVAAGAVALAVGTGGCAAGGGAADPGGPATGAAPPGAPPSDVGSAAADGDTPGRWELQDLSDLERRVLADKQVTDGELREATEALAGCLRRHGLHVVERDAGQPGPGGVVSEFDAGTDAEEERLTGADDRCRADVSAVAEVWVLQRELDEPARRRAMADFVRCARDAGVAAPAVEGEGEGEGFAPVLKRASELVADAQDGEHAAVEACLDAVTPAVATALPGLREALDDLE
jgi:hypothetical protein